MTRPYSMDLRERMVGAVEGGASRRATAAQFDVSPSCVVKLVQRWRQKGTLAPDPVGGGRRAKLADHAERVHALLAATPDSTIAELKTRLAAAGIAVSSSAISRFPQGLRADAKKKTAHAAEQDRPDVAAARRAWREQQPALSPERLVFIDETWATTAMARRYGRARRGQRVVAAVPHGHWKTTTFIAALRHDGLTRVCGQ